MAEQPLRRDMPSVLWLEPFFPRRGGVGGGPDEWQDVSNGGSVDDPHGTFEKIQFGDNLTAFQVDSRTVRVDGSAGKHVGVPIDAAYLLSGVDLVYWYRLGETTPWPTGAAGSVVANVPNFAHDSSGHNRHATATNFWSSVGGTVALPTGDPNLPVTGVTGALEGGNANDGGIWFKWYESTSQYYSCFLQAPSPCFMELATRNDVAAVGAASTFSAWVAFKPETGPSSGIYSLISNWSRSFGISNYGAKLGFNLGTGALNYHVGSINTTTEFDFSTPFGFVIGKWHHFVTQIKRLSTTSYRRRIYLDTNLIYENTGTLLDMGSGCENGTSLSLGGGNSNDIWSVHGGGKIDEVAYWNAELTQDQVTDLFNARVLHDGDTWSTYGVVSVDGSYIVYPTDRFVLANGTFTVTLYSATGWTGQTITVKNTGSGTITVGCSVAETIDGSPTKTLTAGKAISVVSNGANWIAVGGY